MREIQIAWHGYLAGLHEWGYLEPKFYKELWDRFLNLNDSPVDEIMTGSPEKGEYDFETP